jgi:hypothetical protein
VEGVLKDTLPFKKKVMKIVVNKIALELNKKRHIQLILEMAQKAADNGRTAFYYPIPRNQGVDHWELIQKIEDKTEESVYGGYKCIRDGEIKFSIRY